MALDPDHPIIKELWPLGPDTNASDRVEAAFRAYKLATGRLLDIPPSPEQRRNVRDWLLHEESQPDGLSVSLLYRPARYIKPTVHIDIASKSNWLSQAKCPTCIADPSSPAFPVSFGIRVAPFSAQSLTSAKLKNLKNKISKSLENRLTQSGNWKDVSICISVVAVVSAKDRLKDVDNMVKGLLDAIQGHLYFNDQQITHLSVHRLQHQGDAGHYLLFARPVRDALDDVIDPELRVLWPGQDEITLD